MTNHPDPGFGGVCPRPEGGAYCTVCGLCLDHCQCKRVPMSDEYKNIWPSVPTGGKPGQVLISGKEGWQDPPMKCPHNRGYGTCLMCYHDLVAEQQSEIEQLRAALKVAQQSLLECRAAQERGPDWYTHGTRGMYQQVAMQLLRGLQAVKDALGPYDDNGQYLKEMPAAEPRPENWDGSPEGVTQTVCGQVPLPAEKGVLTIVRDVTTVSPNFKMTVATVSDVTRGPCPLCGRTDNHTHTAGPFGMS